MSTDSDRLREFFMRRGWAINLGGGPSNVDDPFAEVLQVAQAIAKRPKPDGWHTYHVCGGLPRMVVGISTGGGEPNNLLCETCGQWCEVRVTEGRQIGIPPEPDMDLLDQRTGE